MLYFKKIIKNISLKILFIAIHYFFSTFWQHLNSTSEKRHIFWDYPTIDLLFGIFTNDNRKGQYLVNMAGGADSHLSVSKQVFISCVICGRALTYRKITMSCLYLYSVRFSFNARLKCINCSRQAIFRSFVWFE